MVNICLMSKGQLPSFCTIWLQKDAFQHRFPTICEVFASHQHHVTVFFDLEKVYDTAWHHGVLLNLYKLGIYGNLPIFIQLFLSNRLLRVRIGNVLSEACQVDESVPQGSILNIILFAVIINNVIGVLPRGVDLYTRMLLHLYFRPCSPLSVWLLGHSIHHQFLACCQMLMFFHWTYIVNP